LLVVDPRIVARMRGCQVGDPHWLHARETLTVSDLRATHAVRSHRRDGVIG
jgi:hypothetical protein